jgi:hypothetical protein
MNLYEFSQQNNNEMGIYISKAEDADLYNATMEEVQRLLTISEEIRVTVKKVTADTPPKTEKKNADNKPTDKKSSDKQSGFCISTGVPIPFDIEKPLSPGAYKKWNEHADPNYGEKYCHFTGEPSNGETSMKQPILRKNWKNAKEKYGL